MKSIDVDGLASKAHAIKNTAIPMCIRETRCSTAQSMNSRKSVAPSKNAQAGWKSSVEAPTHVRTASISTLRQYMQPKNQVMHFFIDVVYCR